MKLIVSLFFMVILLPGCAPSYLVEANWEEFRSIKNPPAFIVSSDFSRTWMAVESVASEMNMKQFVSDKRSGLLRYSTPHDKWDNATIEGNILLREQSPHHTHVSINFINLSHSVRVLPVQVFPVDNEIESKFIDRLRTKLGN